jgi:hypothetical protein
METIKVEGQEYSVIGGSIGETHLMLKRIDKPGWRELVSANSDMSAWVKDNPITVITSLMSCISNYGGDKKYLTRNLARLIFIAEDAWDITAVVYKYNAAGFSVWEMMEYFCDKPDAVSHSLAPGRGNWQRLADYAATWLNYLLEEK